MRRVIAFFQLIRWPNLCIIALTQVLFTYKILRPEFIRMALPFELGNRNLFILVLSSLLIAAGGYIINDYFDIQADQLKRPGKRIVGRYIHRHWAIACHIILSIAGIVAGFILDFTSSIHFLGIFNTGCVLLLFSYSIALKRRPLTGNILISVLAAWTVLICTWCESVQLFNYRHILDIGRITRMSFLYGGFAFIVTMIREAVKDMEYVEADRKLGYHTMPVRWGLNVSKVFAGVWLMVFSGLLLAVLFYILQFGHFLGVVYSIITIAFPLGLVIQAFIKAHTQEDFHLIRTRMKWIMLAGILSLLFI